MKLTQVFKVKCCWEEQRFSHKHDAIEWLAGHIESEHPGLAVKLRKRARVMATSQNGCGYYDDGKSASPESGWNKAPESFRRAWFLHAVENELERKAGK